MVKKIVIASLLSFPFRLAAAFFEEKKIFEVNILIRLNKQTMGY